jgi:hypothetical protein
MSKVLALLAATALLGLSQDEAPIELKWDVKKEDRFDFKWIYSDQTRHEMPKLEGRSEAEAVETYDRRDVEAELFVKEDTPPGAVLMTLKKVAWTQGTHEYEATLVWAEGKAPQVQTKVKVKDKASSLVKKEELVKNQVAVIADGMKKVVEGNYGLSGAAGRPGETIPLRNGQLARGVTSIFGPIYLQTGAPRGSVSLNQAWKDPLEGVQLPPGLVEVDTLSWKITACGAKTGATAKAAFTFPINKSGANAGGGQVTDVRTSGSYSLAREYTFAAEGHLSSSKEEIGYTKKTDAKGKDADFYKDTASRALKQAVTIKLQKKKEEKKPADEKK